MVTKIKEPKTDVTLKDIAEVVGKSVAAVSRALNDHDDIGEETRQYIKQVAHNMGYNPNPMAQRLRKQTTDTLGLILPVFSPKAFDPYFSELLSGIANEAAKHGYDLLVSTCPPGPAEDHAYKRLINSRRVDGLLLTRLRWQDSRAELLLNRNTPFVVIGNSNLPDAVPFVTENSRLGVRAAVQHLIQQGHRQIALINAPANHIFASTFFAGFQEAMVGADLPIIEELLTESDFTQKSGYQATQKLLSLLQPPTAIIAADDIVALGVMAAAQDQGLEIGHDLAVIGYGDIVLAEYSQPPLSTIHRPTYLLGQQACEILVNQLRQKPIADSHVVIEPSLVIRQSSDLALWL